MSEVPPAAGQGKRTLRGVLSWSLVAVALELALIGLWFWRRDAYVALGIEDSVGENLTALLYAVGGIALIVGSCVRLWKGKSSWQREALTLLLGCFFVIVAGEEVSWGQRLLAVETPQVMRRHNTQEELNLHNLDFFSQDSSIMNQHTALNLIALSMGVLIPLAYAFVGPTRRWLDRLYLPVLPLQFSMFFIVGLVHSQTIQKLYPHWVHTEIKELVFSIGFMLGALAIARLPPGSPRSLT